MKTIHVLLSNGREGPPFLLGKDAAFLQNGISQQSHKSAPTKGQIQLSITINGCFERKMNMIPGYHDHEKFVQSHRQNLLNEAEHERRLALLPQSHRSILHYFLGRTALFLRSLRARMQEQAKRRKQVTKHAEQ